MNMATRMILTGTLMVATLLQASCASTEPQVSANQAAAPKAAQAGGPGAVPVTGMDPVTVVRSYVQTANTGDFQKTLAFYADDAVAIAGGGLFIGKQEVAGWLKNDVISTHAFPKSTVVEGPFVVDTGMVSVGRYQKAGMGITGYRTEYLIDKNGKIRFFAPVSVLTADQQAKWQAALAKLGPAPTQTVNPVNVAQSFLEAANAGNYATALAFFADDSAALAVDGSQLFSGKQQVAGWLKTQVQAMHFVPSGWQMQGPNMVASSGMVSLDVYKQMGIDPVQYRAVFWVQNGAIRFFRLTAVLTPEQQSKRSAEQATPVK